jgi:hypothetical protein
VNLAYFYRGHSIGWGGDIVVVAAVVVWLAWKLWRRKRRRRDGAV